MPDLLAHLVIYLGGYLVAGLLGVWPASAPAEEPLTVHADQVASDEQIAQAAAEVPELLRRAEDAMARARE